jgi:hypothetical protein
MYRRQIQMKFKLTHNKEYTTTRIFKKVPDGGQVWTDLNTPTLTDFFQAK